MTKLNEKDLRTIIAHPFLALAREFNWNEAQLAAAKKLIDVTVIRLMELDARRKQQTAKNS